MTPGQVWWLITAKIPKEAASAASDRSKVSEMIRAAKAKEALENG
jgi:hypothetical protein|tara:strand:- start:120 stop:254 length:135 start_codon:yes stop_codon:yes gene_type:complete